ncbi:MAG: hypothetical protein MK066_13975 [Crocinitomicaceae bacterium]|nr:hypothetical protein [Crocinitomicaceae bacterium]
MSDIQTIGSVIGLPNHMQINRLGDDGKTAEETYTVLVNPTSYSVVHNACYNADQGIQSTGTTYGLNKAKPESMSLDLLFDSTGSLGNVPLLKHQTVLDQVNYFLDVAFILHASGEKKPKGLQLVWGKMEFYGVLDKIAIDYTHFDHTGFPIRAKAACTFSGGRIRFTGKPKKRLKPNGEERKVVDFAKQRHAINAVLKYGSYVPLIVQQPKKALPKSLRLAEELAKLIIK